MGCLASWARFHGSTNESADGFLASAKDRVVLPGFPDESFAHASRPEYGENGPEQRLRSGKSTQRDARETADSPDQ